jgi:carboxymethylenebutenolidase
MSTPLDEYKPFVDGLVKIRPSVEARWVVEKGWPKIELTDPMYRTLSPAARKLRDEAHQRNEHINHFLAELTAEQREILADIVQEARDSGIHDTLVYINDSINLSGLRLSVNGIELAIEPYGTEMYFDWTARREGDEWPDETKSKIAMSQISGTMIEFLANGDNAPGYLAQPAGEGPFPGVIVIQEWWGLNDHIKDVVERFAREGFVALAPDLYRGQVALEPDEARKLAMELEHPRAIKDIQGAANYLIAQPFVEPKRPGVVGFCMGGGLALAMSYEGRNLGAVVVFYGRGILDEATAQRVSAPLLGLYGEADAGIPVETVQANERKLRANGKTVEMVVYPGAPHAFFNDTRPHIYHKEAAEDAWRRMLAWFRAHLK